MPSLTLRILAVRMGSLLLATIQMAPRFSRTSGPRQPATIACNSHWNQRDALSPADICQAWAWPDYWVGSAGLVASAAGAFLVVSVAGVSLAFLAGALWWTLALVAAGFALVALGVGAGAGTGAGLCVVQADRMRPMAAIAGSRIVFMVWELDRSVGLNAAQASIKRAIPQDFFVRLFRQASCLNASVLVFE